MPNPVLKRSVSLGLVTCAVFMLAAACSAAQTGSVRDVQRTPPEPWPRMSLIAEGSLGHRLEIATEAGAFNRATGILTFHGQTWRVTDAECSGFRTVLDALRALPPLRPGPILLQPGASASNTLPPLRVHGESWVIRTQAFVPNWSSMDIEMRGGQGPYASWASDTVEAIKACGRTDG